MQVEKMQVEKMRHGFSLIELLVVVAIIAVLAAIATPLYIQYQYRSEIAVVYNLASQVAEELITTYAQTGSIPGQINFMGTIVISGVGESINLNNIANFQYVSCPANHPTGTLSGVLVDIGLSNIGNVCPNAVTMPNDSNCQIRIAKIIEPSGAITTYCGGWQPGYDLDLYPIYQPSGCNCTNYSNMWSNCNIGGGTGTNGC